MNEKVLHTLEFDKIIDRLTGFATSDPGRRLCRQLRPSIDYETILQDQQQTTDALDRIRMKGSCSFSGVRDLRASMKRLEVGGSLGAAELLQIVSLLRAASRAVSYGYHEPSKEIPDDSLDGLFRELDPLGALSAEISRCILSEDEIADNASPGLANVRRRMKSIESRVHVELNQILSAHRNHLQEGIVTLRDGRYCLPVKAEYKSQFPGMVHDQSATGSTIFMEPMAIIKLNNDYREAEAQEKREIGYVLDALSLSAAPCSKTIIRDQEILSTLDFIFARAELSRSYRGTSPVFNRDRVIDIHDGRHPLLDPRHVVPTSIRLGEDFNLLIVTGPNTGGKTVSLKTTGLFTLMGQSGLHIPALEGSRLGIFREVFADIGDEQSIEQNLSTFSAHMKNIVGILQQADPDSLCLFDELGAGTDPTEGAALAISVLHFLHRMDARCMATTHYSELKVYALQTPGVENASCEFNVDTLMPTYRLMIGIPGKSNAFAIAQRLGLPDYIIDDARGRIRQEDESFEDVIAHLQESRVTIEQEREEIGRYKAQIEQLKRDLEKREERFRDQREKVLQKAQEEARRILLDAKETADRSIRGINKIAQNPDISKQLEEHREKIRRQISAVDKKHTEKPRKAAQPVDAQSLHLGDTIEVISMGTTGQVTALPDSKNMVTVQMGILSAKVKLSDIALTAESDARKDIRTPGRAAKGAGKTGAGGSGSISMAKSMTISPEVNLIGMTTDEAIPAMDKYLDDAYLAHLEEVRVIHGRGTGALRKAVHTELRRLKYVKSYRDGSYDEGGNGATVVTFK